MDSSRNAVTPGDKAEDLSALAWVHEELRRSLDAAHKALRRFVKETEALGDSDVDSVDPSVLRTARVQIHQGVGALEMVGLPEAATLLRASETAVQRFVAKPHKLAGTMVDDIERASFALLDYLSRMLAGKTVSPISMFPQFRAVQEAAGAERVHPADLWAHDWQWRELPDDPLVVPRQPDAATHSAFEGQMLPLMRGSGQLQAAAQLSDVCAGLGAGAGSGPAATMWKLASAMFEAQTHGLLGFDVFAKRMVSRLLAQFRALERGGSDISERLAQDLLFFCAQSASPGDGRKTPRLAAVRQVYGLARHAPVDYAVSTLGRFDPAWIAQARKRVTAAKESWSAVAGGELHRMAGMSEQFSLVGDSLKRLFPLGETFGHELQMAVGQTQQSGSAPPTALAMEVATSLLYVEAALEDTDFDHPELAARVRRMAERLSNVRQGRAPDPLEPWMEELYRRVSDRQTMGSVVQELRASLSEAEKQIDLFFRNPRDNRVLIPVPNQLGAMRGVLSVLGMDHAAAALLRMRDEVDGLASTEVDLDRVVQAGVFDRLAGNLGALGFLIDMLGVQPQLAKSLFRFNPQTGEFSPVMGRSDGFAAYQPDSEAMPALVEPRLIEQAQQLAHSAQQSEVPLAEVERDLEQLAREAQAAEQPALAATVQKAQEALDSAHGLLEITAARDQLSEALVDFVHSVSEPMALADEPPARPFARSAPVPMPPFEESGLEQDDEMREVFLEEAREVLGQANEASAQLAGAPSDLSLVTLLRRAFHTLKGSSRMVGLKEFGEAAWVCEQLYNTHLAEQRPAEARHIAFTSWVLGYLGEWVEDIAARQPARHDAATVQAAAQRLAGDAEAQVPAEPELADTPLAAVASGHAPLGLPPDLPSAADLDLSLPEPAAAAAPAATEAEPIAEGLAFELDLSTLDAFDVADFSPSQPPELGRPSVPGRFEQTEVLDVSPSSFAATEPPETDLPLDLVDFDLGDAMAPSMVEALEPTPSRTGALAGLPELPAANDAVSDAAEEHVAELPADELVKVVGPLRIGIPLFNIYLNEADELSRRLTTELAEWAMELHRPIGEAPIALAHSLAGSSATVGFADLSHLARLLEHALMRSHAIGQGTPDEARLFVDAAEDVRRLLHQFAAGFLKEPKPELLERLAEHELSSARRLDAVSAAAEHAEAAESADVPLPEIDAGAAAGALIQPEPEPEPEATADDTSGAVMDTRPGELAQPAADEARTSGFGVSAFGGGVTAFGGTTVFGGAATVFGGETRFDPLGLAELKPLEALPADAPRTKAESRAAGDIDDDIDAIDAVDPELFPIFEEEGEELLGALGGKLRDWARQPGEASHPAACMRTLHTLKGGARLAGAMRLGEMAHRLESRIETLLAHSAVQSHDVEELQAYADKLMQAFEAVRSNDAAAYAEAEAIAISRPAPLDEPMVVVTPVAPPVAKSPVLTVVPSTPAPEAAASAAEAATPAPAAPVPELPAIDWSGFAPAGAAKVAQPERLQSAVAAVRVRAPLLDRLVNQAGEISITRSRIDSEIKQIRGSLGDLTENLERLRGQLRDIELQAETQMTSRMEAAKASQSFDPLEFDRFTRFQELTRMMAESVNDVATVQRTLQRSLNSTEDELATQERLNRELQDDLLRTRMVEFEGLSERLYRVVRQAAKETGKQVRLDIVGGSIEVDRGVLDRMTGAFEHLLRNCVTHGIESPAARVAAGKDATGSITVSLTQEGNEVGVEFRDDGSGLDLQRIRSKGAAMGLIPAGVEPSDAELAALIFTPGFSTADVVTELAGRGVGMDVVRSDVNAMGGRVETATTTGQGTAFRLILPLTTAVTQVVMLRCGDTTVAVPSTLIEIVRRAKPEEVDLAYQTGAYQFGDRSLQFFWLGALLQHSPRGLEATGRTRTVVVIRSAQQRIALHVDEVLGNQEVVVKNLGTQLSRLPGLAGMTLLASGAVALIYNPVALATLYGDSARMATLASLQSPDQSLPQAPQPVVAAAPLVLVVDDSLTVRRVTQRLLVREGYRVVLAKDGMDALERLGEELPQVVLSDIEMPRMDGFDLVRNIRGDARLQALPVIMITSRIAQKHRDYAAELGVDHYLGKPYSEEDLLALIARYTAAESVA
jgi:chemosensory pili system protein ChpA (sensor histidine kinase/response regulator)